jgi:3-hydroxyisobutyrate dehydrogenase-like beta-hydroxyacid dehydrogenase
MALNLQRKGYRVTGWNRTPGKGGELAELGGRLAATPREAATGADVVITMLGGPASLVDVAAGPAGFLGAVEAGALWLDSSTIGPSAAREMAELAARYGVAFVDAPVTGGPHNAQDATLVFMVGGAESDVKRAEPLLAAMGRGSHIFGAVGQGAAAKAVNNMLCGTLIAAFAEAVVLAEQLGVDQTQMIDFMAAGAAGAPLVRAKGAIIKTGEYPASFQLKWMEKDVGLALREAFNQGFSLPVSGNAYAALAAARQAGFGEQDVSAVHAHIRKVVAGRPEAPSGE